MKIEMFTGPRCSYCARARELLHERGLAFIQRDITAPGVREEFARRLPREKSIPQIFIDGAHIGGYEDLKLRLG